MVIKNTPQLPKKVVFGDLAKINLHKIFVESHQGIPFTEFNLYDLYRTTFEDSEPGRIKPMLTIREMTSNLGPARKY